MTADSLKTQLEALYRKLLDTGMPFGDEYEKELFNRIDDIMVPYFDDVRVAIEEVRKGPRPFIRLRHYEGLRENKRLGRMIKELVSRSSDPDKASIARNYVDFYTLTTEIVRLAKSYLAARK